jgi:hypothetical protein
VSVGVGLLDGEAGGEDDGRLVGCTLAGLVYGRTEVMGCTAALELGVSDGLGSGLGLADGVVGGVLRCWVVLLPRSDVGGLEL